MTGLETRYSRGIGSDSSSHLCAIAACFFVASDYLTGQFSELHDVGWMRTVRIRSSSLLGLPRGKLYIKNGYHGCTSILQKQRPLNTWGDDTDWRPRHHVMGRTAARRATHFCPYWCLLTLPVGG